MQLGALDVDAVQGGIAAILPDSVSKGTLAETLGAPGVRISAAIARDDGSTWLVNPQVVRVGTGLVISPESAVQAGTLRMTDSTAFGTGHHPTTALCIEAIEEILTLERVTGILDVGTGSGILALTALARGVPQAVALDVDPSALEAAANNARLNGMAERLRLVLGSAGDVEGSWPLVVANVLTAPLIEMAPHLVRRVGHRGRLILSGISWSLEAEVRQTYQHLGMRHVSSETRGGWTMLVTQASW